MAKRESIHIPGVQHAQPIPFASKVGNMLFTGAIMGTDASTGKVPEGAEEQVQNCFENLKTTLDTAGFSPEDIGFMSVYLKSNDVRQHVNGSWLEMFPDEHSRPARHTVLQENLPFLVQIQVVATKG